VTKLNVGNCDDVCVLCHVPNNIKVIKSRRIRWTEYVAGMGEMRSTCNILVGKLEEKSPLGRLKRRWEYNFRMGLREIGW
jgi:hypothetical protein